MLPGISVDSSGQFSGIVPALIKFDDKWMGSLSFSGGSVDK